MAAYASLVSLMQIIHQIQNHPTPPISMDRKQVESLTEIVVFLQEFLEGYKSPFADGDEADPLEIRIADAVFAAEDVIESHIVDQICPASSASVDLYETRMNVIKEMDLIKEEMVEIVGSEKSADLYTSLKKLTKHMDLIEKEVLQFIGSSTPTDLYERLVKVIEDMDLINQKVMEIVKYRIRAAPDLYESLMKMIEDIDLIKKEVMEIVALKDQIQVSSTSADLYDSMESVIEDLDLIKKEVMLVEIVQAKDQPHRQVTACSTSSKMLSYNSSTSSLTNLNSSTMVGFDDIMLQLMDKLTNSELDRQVIPIIGMGGIGKTTLARNVYEHSFISHHFDICAWVTISQQYNTEELLHQILSQANKQDLSQMSEEDEIGVALHKCLSCRRYLIVLDDMWSIKAWEDMQLYFPDDGHSSRIMVTTRLSNLGSKLNSNYGIQMKFLDEESSWSVFSKIMLWGKSCPLELKEIGKKIVKSCKGLPLSIVVTGGLLKKLEPTKECWESIRRSINSLVNLENDRHCLKILKLSYNHLPVHLKSCFLYMGTYEADSKIQVSRVIKLWVSEGFLKPIRGKSLERVAKEYLGELVDRNLVLVHEFGKTGNMKYLKMHDLLRDLCLREAEKERFYHVVGQHSPQGTCSQRRVVILQSTSKEKVVDVRKSILHARSYKSDHGRVQSLPCLKLLRILKAFYIVENKYSPAKMLNLLLLDIHSLAYDQLSSSINLHWSIQTLIVSHCGKHKNAPVEIWNMSQLRHVYIPVLDRYYGRGALHLPDPPIDSSVIMENLQTLNGVMNFKCDETMVRRIPNIRKLGLIGSLDDVNASIHNIHCLQKLESLSCEHFNWRYFSRNITFPHSLKTLTLGILCGRMEDVMEKVSTLPLLQKLKLSYGDFTTGKWETFDGQFPSLKYLSLAWCYRLECWTMESSSHFPCLERLHLSSLAELKEIPAELGDIPTLKSVVLYECSESAVKSAKRIVEEQEELQGEDELSFQVEVKLWRRNEELLSLANPNFQVTS